MAAIPPNTFRVVTWNIGGAKFLELPESPTQKSSYTRGDFQRDLHDALKRLTRDYEPHVILLQETVRFSSETNDLIVVDDIPDYLYDPAIAIDTINQSHPQKWKKYYKDSDGNQIWPERT